MFWAPLIAAGVSAAASAYGAHKQNQAQKAAAQKQMDFQERMSGTSYQRSMADMRAAGLNPMLAYSQGGATTPGGAQPNIVNPMGTEMSGVASTALQAAQTSANVNLTKAQTRTAQAIAKREEQWTKTLDGNPEAQMLMRSGSIPNTAAGMAAVKVRDIYSNAAGAASNSAKAYRSRMRPQAPPSTVMTGRIRNAWLKSRYKKKPRRSPASRKGWRYASSFKRTAPGPFHPNPYRR